MADRVTIRDISLPGSGQRIHEVELGPELVIRIVVGEVSDEQPPSPRCAEQLLAAALAGEIAKQFDVLPTPTVLEVRGSNQPGSIAVSVYPVPSSPAGSGETGQT